MATASWHRIVVIRTDRLGETLLTMPAAAALHDALPQARISLLVQPDLKPLLAEVPWLDEVLADDPGRSGSWWQEALRLRRLLAPRRFDLAVVANSKKASHAAVWLAGIPTRVGYDRKWGRLLTHRVPDRKSLGGRHEVEYNLDLITALGVPAPIRHWRLPCSGSAQAEVLQLLEHQGVKASDQFVAVHPWTSNPRKQWPADRYQQLIGRLSQRLPVAVIGGPDEQRHASSVLPAPMRGVLNLVGRLSLPQLAALLERARLLVSNDSGPVHLASAVNAKTVVLFGSSDPSTGPGRWGPWGAGHTVICKPSVEMITFEEVMAAVEEELSGR